MSRFLNQNTGAEPAGSIDFARATLLPEGGTTCLLYRTRLQRREVFVKRLREEFRSNALYLDALEKEFDIMSGLSHPSLPYYREWHHDFIVIDFIDGQTLEEMIQANDPWLQNESNLISMLRELVEVVDYLHRHNVVHCDIKPDNIMISANTRNLVLIDFDKAYSDAHNDSPGDPALFGLEDENVGSVRIDFQAIGKVAERLKAKISPFKFVRYKQFANTCFSSSANPHSLLEGLNYKPRRGKQIMWFALILLAATITAILFIFPINQSKNSDVPLPGPLSYARDSLLSSPPPPSPPPPTEEIQHHLPKPQSNANLENKPLQQETSQQRPLSQEETLSIALQKAEQLDKRVLPAYQGLSKSLDRLAQLPSDTSLSSDFLLSEIRALGEKEDEIYAETFATVQDMHPGISSREVWRILSLSKVYSSYKRRSETIKRNFAKEYEKRKITEK